MTEISNVRPDYQALIKAEQKARRATHRKIALLRRLDLAITWSGGLLALLAVLYHFA